MGDQQHAVDWAHEYKVERDEFEAECIRLAAEKKELVEALTSIMETLSDEGWAMRRTELANKYRTARALLARLK